MSLYEYIHLPFKPAHAANLASCSAGSHPVRLAHVLAQAESVYAVVQLASQSVPKAKLCYSLKSLPIFIMHTSVLSLSLSEHFCPNFYRYLFFYQVANTRI